MISTVSQRWMRGVMKAAVEGWSIIVPSVLGTG
jgi:hypothetical protein